MHGGSRLRACVRGASLAAIASALGGCWVVLGESFTGYASLGDAGTGGATDGGPDTGDGGGDARDSGVAETGTGTDASSAPHAIDDCLPKFVVSNGIGYPTRAPPPLEITAALDALDTDSDARCVFGPATPYCLLLATSIHIATGAKLGTVGKRPLVVMAVHDLTIDDNGLLDLAGGESGSFPGPGDHGRGAATGAGGGGGNAEPGGGSACGAIGGPTIDTALVAGGNGGGALDPQQGCRLGGSGGGAVQLVSLCGAITVRGTINASGGGGGPVAAPDVTCPEGYGGGAGGTVWFQAATKVTFDAVTAQVDLAGGGGGGGACRATGANPWTVGTAGNRSAAGGGGACAGPTGGPGGAGAVGGTNARAPAAGGVGTGGGETKCGGGGGARGRLVLQAPSTKCADAPNTGLCTELP